MRRSGQTGCGRGAVTRRRGVLAVMGVAALLLAAGPLLAQKPTEPGLAAVVPIRGDIDNIMLRSIERRVTAARASGAGQIIFEIDTPGGAVVSAIDISRLIMRLGDDGVRTVAWVNPQAYSAGAMIALSCSEIWMSAGASLGDCAPIMIGASELGAAERAKVESPILQIFREAAQRNGYDQLLGRSMVQAGVEVWWVERIDPATTTAPATAPAEPFTPERRFVDGAEKQRLIDDVDEGARQWRLVQHDSVPQPVDGADTLLTVGPDEAVALGLARGRASSLTQLAQELQLVMQPVVKDITGWERFVMWLNSPLVRGVFFLIMILGGYIEFQSPGLILPGTVALVAAIIFFGAPYAAGLADAWTLVLMIVGLVLLAVEILVLPGFGVAGILGLLCVGVALVGTFVPPEPREPGWWPVLPTLQATWDGVVRGMLVLSASAMASLVGLVVLARYLPQLPGGRRLVPGNPEGVNLTLYDAHPNTALVGDVGVVTGPLKPAGLARFGNDVVDVTTQGEYVDVGVRVQVIRREGQNIFVRALSNDA